MLRNKKLIIAAVCCLLAAFAVGLTVYGSGLQPLSGVAAAAGAEAKSTSAETEEETAADSTTKGHVVIGPSVSDTTIRGRTTETASSKATTSKTTTQKTTTATQKTTVPHTTARATQANAGAVTTTEPVLTVTFDSNGGTAVKSQSLHDGDKVTKPADPTRKGFTFAGWYKDAALTDALNFKTDRVSDSVTVYAKWEKAVGTVTYKVTVDSSLVGGTVTFSPAEALPGERIEFTVIPDEGKILKAGTLKVNGAVCEQLYFTMPKKNVVITAEFTDAPVDTQKESGIGKGILLLIGGLVLVCATLVVIAFAMREKPIGQEADEWKDTTIMLTEYKDKPPQSSEGAIVPEDPKDPDENE